ncbi:Ku protein [Oryzifoliimicrobium ureilyticus]|uniref:non-homologous end joining protein Ku n=1 Tax=Oryzifoliimicrobium ureilyticus TaxID=3113724 RepID=UPI0030760933
MAARASWKGQLKFDDIACAIGLYTGVSSSDHVSFNIVNRRTGHRVERQYVDSDTGKPVPREDQIRGYQLDNGDYLRVEAEEIASIVPNSDKVLHLERFIPHAKMDTLYLEKPYYIVPTDEESAEDLALMARALKDAKVAGLAEAVLFRRNRKLLVYPQGEALIGVMLKFDYEVRQPAPVFRNIPDIHFDKEMLQLAGHIIETKKGSFDPASYEDRYETALIELVKAKLEGKAAPKKKRKSQEKVVDLMEALRESAKMAGKSNASGKRKTKASAGRTGSSTNRKAS